MLFQAVSVNIYPAAQMHMDRHMSWIILETS